MLIVLDNAADAAQVMPLLPGSATCMVVVTSRHRLAGLFTTHGARWLDLGVLGEAQARELLTWHVGAQILAAEPDAVADLIASCAGLPLALAILAARAATHPDFRLAALAEELGDHAARLDALDTGERDLSLRAVLSWSYHALTTEAATLLGLLGLVPGPHVSLGAVAALIALPTARTRALLRELEISHLLQQYQPGRYRMHDLVRLCAAEEAHHQPRRMREAALRRLVGFSLHTAYAAERLLDPHRVPMEIDRSAVDCNPRPLADEAAAMAWLDDEHPCLLAAQQLAGSLGWHTAVWQLARTLDIFHARRGHLHDNFTAWRAGLAAAEHLEDPVIQALAHRRLGYACARAGRHCEAVDHLQRAMALAEPADDLRSQAHTHLALVRAWGLQGDDQRALLHAVHALRLFQVLDNPAWQANALSQVGWFHGQLGHHAQARVYCEAALTLHRQHHNSASEAVTLDSLGHIAHRTGRYGQAVEYFQQALVLFRHLGDSYDEADTLDHLDRAHAALGHNDRACRAWSHALTRYQGQHRTADVERIRLQLAAIDQHWPHHLTATVDDHPDTPANGLARTGRTAT